MKQSIKDNIIMVVQSLFLCGEILISVLYKDLDTINIVIPAIIGAWGVLLVRFAYSLAKLRNKWHSTWNRRNSSDSDDEPSDLAVFWTKFCGYIFTCVPLLFIFLF